jgi:serine/threonine protein phosphatase 1
MPRRTIAIGDIHGCTIALDTLLAALAPREDDLIVPLGDYMDRGPDSRGVIDRLIALARRCQLVPILGNHDQMLLESFASPIQLSFWKACGGDAALLSYGGHLDLIPAEHVEFLEGCREFLETETHIFTHANYYEDLEMGEQPSSMLRWESLRVTVPGPHLSGKAVVVGHTSQKTGEVWDLGHIKCIDTYCYGGGWLTALEGRTGRVWQANQRGELRESVIDA